MSVKAEELMRQQYLVPRKSVKKLREMSRREGVSAGELARRAIEAYTSGNVIAVPEEEMASRAVLKDIHNQVRTVLTRIDASLSEIRASERALADGTFRAQVVAETRAWFDAHPDEAQGIVELFAPQAAA
jgi:enamine deaminase RidA (YjgF/YER057c/UK114 family)